MAAAQDPEPVIEAQHAHLHAQLAEIDKATANLISAIEGGTDPSLVNPRLNQLRAEREMLANQLGNLAAPDQLTSADIDALMAELGGLPQVLGDATPFAGAAQVELRSRLDRSPAIECIDGRTIGAPFC